MAANSACGGTSPQHPKPKGHYQARNEATLVTGDIGKEGFLAVRIKDEDGEQCGADHKAGDAKAPYADQLLHYLRVDEALVDVEGDQGGSRI